MAAAQIGYPLMARVAYALGGLGSGFCKDDTELTELCKQAFVQVKHPPATHRSWCGCGVPSGEIGLCRRFRGSRRHRCWLSSL